MNKLRSLSPLLSCFSTLILLLTACNYPGLNLPATEVPIYVPPLGKTALPTPTATPNPASLIQLGEAVFVPEGAFVFRPITIWDSTGVPMSLEINGEKISQSNAEETLFFSLVSEPAGTSTNVRACQETLLQRMTTDIPDLTAAPAQVIQSAGFEGLQTDLSGHLFSKPMLGSLIVFYPGERCFSLLGLAADAQATKLWQSSGKYALEKILSSLNFSDEPSQVTCQVSSDPEYGFSPEKPIQVGNINLYDGISRMEAYLNTLRGPANEEIFYSRQTPSYNQQDEIVDAYQISYDGLTEPRLLYFDIYHYDTPLAPLGYTCESTFPLYTP